MDNVQQHRVVMNRQLTETFTESLITTFMHVVCGKQFTVTV
jgi:hypothetical protein